MNVDFRPIDHMTSSRRDALRHGRCVIAFGHDASWFRDDLSAREYRISGLCQECQDAVFGVDE